MIDVHQSCPERKNKDKLVCYIRDVLLYGDA